MAKIIVTEKDAARFWSKTRRNERTGCLEWTKHLNSTGYGHMKIKKREELAHRIAWVISGREIPDGLLVLHTCDNPSCVEISHLFVGDHDANMADMVAKGRSLSGDRNPARRCPERLPRGAEHWMHLSPEMVPRGERSGPAKLTDDSVRAIRAANAAGELQAVICERYGVTQSAVSRIVNRKAWSHVS